MWAIYKVPPRCHLLHVCDLGHELYRSGRRKGFQSKLKNVSFTGRGDAGPLGRPLGRPRVLPSRQVAVEHRIGYKWQRSLAVLGTAFLRLLLGIARHKFVHAGKHPWARVATNPSDRTGRVNATLGTTFKMPLAMIKPRPKSCFGFC